MIRINEYYERLDKIFFSKESANKFAKRNNYKEYRLTSVKDYLNKGENIWQIEIKK